MGAFANLPTLVEQQQQRRAIPKGAMKTQLEQATAKARHTKRDEAAFRAAVWARDGARCRLCNRVVKRTLKRCVEQGHVHHLRGRRVKPEDKCNPRAAVLLCASCHAKAHNGALRIQP